MLRGLLVYSLAISGAVASAHAGPMDLGNLEPRWVHVAFEVSPHDRPGQVDSVYTSVTRAWFEPADVPGQVNVTVPGPVVERMLLARYNPQAGSFGDFVWSFDARTGHVVSATLRGALLRRLDFGFLTAEVEADIQASMDTESVAGYTPARRFLGQLIFAHCADPNPARCTLVQPAEYDETRGYVNAVGSLIVRYHGLTLHTFSPLGEAVFSELPDAAPGHTELELDRHGS